VLKQREAELTDLSEGVRYDIATALLDVRAAAAAVEVAQNAETLARTELEQTQDRFRAGVASSIELAESQESLSRATEQRISSIYAHTIAKALVARAMGEVEERFVELVEGRH
jgi:outer membrane protein TolC